MFKLWADGGFMSRQSAHIGVAPHAWLQHNMPWLGLVALLLGLFRDSDEIGFDPDDHNG
ncbi:hypothetical protein [Devosia limi]|uniref:Uncharacterized protein n=1 Tax=Devosia limi DSM 17137 TaxID=1121477 RepID=A0A1M5DNY8_9HYPH|nr:hypothetical protein [Devosia limi]SHF68492.1 hypothetical protein SAMN02745223_03319 [Devosia limi DSM 17137]